MIVYTYIVHSDEDEQKYYAAFDSRQEALDYCRENPEGKTWITQVELDQNDFGEPTATGWAETIWSYKDELPHEEESIDEVTEDEEKELDADYKQLCAETEYPMDEAASTTAFEFYKKFILKNKKNLDFLRRAKEDIYYIDEVTPGRYTLFDLTQIELDELAKLIDETIPMKESLLQEGIFDKLTNKIKTAFKGDDAKEQEEWLAKEKEKLAKQVNARMAEIEARLDSEVKKVETPKFTGAVKDADGTTLKVGDNVEILKTSKKEFEGLVAEVTEVLKDTGKVALKFSYKGKTGSGKVTALNVRKVAQAEPELELEL